MKGFREYISNFKKKKIHPICLDRRIDDGFKYMYHLNLTIFAAIDVDFIIIPRRGQNNSYHKNMFMAHSLINTIFMAFYHWKIM